MSERPANPDQGSLLPREPANYPQELVATADAGVDTVLETLASVPEAPVAEHPELYQRVHDELAAELDTDAHG